MQKEQLSAFLMDGETWIVSCLTRLAHNPEMQKTWESYHLIRDSMRGDTPEVLHFDISSRVMAAIEEEPVRQPGDIASRKPSLRRINGRKCHSGRSTSVGGTAYPNGRSSMRITCSYRWRPAL